MGESASSKGYDPWETIMTDRPSIAIIGAGLMGTGLARLFTGAGCKVAVADPDPGARDRIAAALSQLMVTQSVGVATEGTQLVIEAAPEIAELKQSIFAELAAVTGDETLLATNSSVIPVGTVTEKLSDAVARRTLGTHFWNPPDIIPLVEVIRGPRTADTSIQIAMDMLRAAGKEPVYVQRDVVPGNRLQHALWREAIALVEEGVCLPADVDHIIKRSFGLRLAVLGPLENADLVGIDLTRQIHDVVLPTLSRATVPSPELVARLASGKLGVKSGSGFYDGWTPEKVRSLRQRLADHLASLRLSDPT